MNPELQHTHHTKEGKYAQFRIQDGEFLYERGSSMGVDSLDRFSLNQAVQFAVDILDLVQRNSELNPRTSNMDSVTQDLDEEGVDTLQQFMIDAMKQNNQQFDPKKLRKLEELSPEQIGMLLMSGLEEKDWEKTKEDLLQKIYDEHGEDWFTSREFKELYNQHYNRNTYKDWLTRLKGTSLDRRPVPDDLDIDGRINYQYKLSSNALRTLKEYGSFTSRQNPNYQKKKIQMAKTPTA